MVKVNQTDWITVENTHEGIITPEEYERAQAQMRVYAERNMSGEDYPLRGKIRCGVCGYSLLYAKVKRRYFYCHTPRVNAAYACVGRTPEDDILDTVKQGLHAQALMAVELHRLWEEQHQAQNEDADDIVKNLSKQRETHQQLSQQINDLYESYALGEISKSEYLAIKAAAVKRRDATADQIAKLETALDNIGRSGSLQNPFVSTFEQYIDVEEITSEIVSEVLSEVRVFPDRRLELLWNFQDEQKKLLLELAADSPQ